MNRTEVKHKRQGRVGEWVGETRDSRSAMWARLRKEGAMGCMVAESSIEECKSCALSSQKVV